MQSFWSDRLDMFTELFVPGFASHRRWTKIAWQEIEHPFGWHTHLPEPDQDKRFSSLFRSLCGWLNCNAFDQTDLDMFTKLSVPGFASHRGSKGSHLDPGRKFCCRCRKVLQAKLLMRGFQEMSKVANARNSLFHFQNSTLRITSNLWQLDRRLRETIPSINADHLEWER